MGSARDFEIAERRQQRQAQKRQRELERQAKEQAKLSAIEQARLEVSTFENRIEVLLSVHKEQGQMWDWVAVASSLSSPVPQRHSYHELKARQQACLSPPEQQLQTDSAITQARLEDEKEYQRAVQNHAAELEEIDRIRTLARRILDGDPKAYTQALVELSPLAELSGLGSAIHFTVHTPQLVESVMKVNGVQAIPSEVKSLTATEKLSVKPMPRVRFHEIYQDYISSCILRVAREVFAVLPVSTVLITASASDTVPSKPRGCEHAVLSVAITRDSMDSLDFESLDPSDAIRNFLHRGDFKASRKTSAFAPITPLTPADIARPAAPALDHAELLDQARRLRKDLRAEAAKLNLPAEAPTT